jgi:hypothetical protein
MPAELLPQHARAYGVSVSVCSFWGCQLINLLAYLPFKDAVGITFSFIPFLCSTVICFVIFLFYLPETKGTSPEQLFLDRAGRGSSRKGKQTATVAPVESVTIQTSNLHSHDCDSISRI